MKPHVIVQLTEGTAKPSAAHWSELVHDPSAAPGPFHPDVDPVLLRHKAQALVTQEYKPGATDWSTAEIAAGLDRVYRLVLLSKQRIPPGLVEDIRLLPVVKRADPGRIASVPLPQAQSATFSHAMDWARSLINLEAAHEITKGSSSTTVAILDTGINANHRELRDTIAGGTDFVDIIDGTTDFIGDFIDADHDPDDEVGHGTHVAGIIAGAGHEMPIGVAPKVRTLAVRVLAAMRQGDQVRGAGLVDNINVGVKWAVDQGAEVINMSLGVPHTGGGLPHREVVEYAQRLGTTVVAASGNDGSDRQYYPGAFPYVITVGAVGRDERAAEFSTFGPQVDLVAPGAEIYSCGLDNGYAFASGTSHAAPFVAGTVALLKGHPPKARRTYSDGDCKRALRATADRPGAQMRDLKHGFGRVNVVDSLRFATHDLEIARRR